VITLVSWLLPIRSEARIVVLLMATFGVAELFLRLVERPSRALARRLLDPRPAPARGPGPLAEGS
jgi:peptidoglycan/LPS O-acetylase OafA/YrhL